MRIDHLYLKTLRRFGRGRVPLPYQETTLLNDAQIKALPTTPVPILGALGANRVPVLVRAIGLLDSQAGAYANINGTLTGAIQNGDFYSNALSNLRAQLDETQLTLIQFTPRVYYGGAGSDIFENVFTLASQVNQQLELTLDNGGSGNLTGGHPQNTLRMLIAYMIFDAHTGIFE